MLAAIEYLKTKRQLVFESLARARRDAEQSREFSERRAVDAIRLERELGEYDGAIKKLTAD